MSGVFKWECKTVLTAAITNSFFCLRKNRGSLWESLHVRDTRVCGGIRASCKLEMGNCFVKWFMIGTSATLGLVNISFRFSKFLSESDKKRWEFVSKSFAEEPVKSLPKSRGCWTKSVMSTSWIKEILFPLSPSNENL